MCVFVCLSSTAVPVNPSESDDSRVLSSPRNHSAPPSSAPRPSGSGFYCIRALDVLTNTRPKRSNGSLLTRTVKRRGPEGRLIARSRINRKTRTTPWPWWSHVSVESRCFWSPCLISSCRPIRKTHRSRLWHETTLVASLRYPCTAVRRGSYQIRSHSSSTFTWKHSKEPEVEGDVTASDAAGFMFVSRPSRGKLGALGQSRLVDVVIKGSCWPRVRVAFRRTQAWIFFFFLSLPFGGISLSFWRHILLRNNC